MTDFPTDVAVAIEAAERAGKVVADHYARFAAIPDAAIDISTEADRDSQETILTFLAEHYPEDAFCAEEATATLTRVRRQGRRLWVIDPIDGTRGFARKNGQFSIMIGLVEDGDIAVGVVQEPATGVVTFAWKGGGCWRRERGQEPVRCAVTTTTAMADAALVESHGKPGRVSRSRRALNPGRVVETYSAGLKLALVASGAADLYANTYEAFHDWDVCAGQILVEEAGGMVTRIDGRPIRYPTPGHLQTGGVLASNGRLHSTAVAAFAAVGG